MLAQPTVSSRVRRPLGILEDRASRQEAVTHIQDAVMGDDGAGVDVEADPADKNGGVHPVRDVDQVDHRDVVAVVDAVEECPRQLPSVALLQACPGAESPVPNCEQGLVEVRPLRVEPRFLDHPRIGCHVAPGSVAHGDLVSMSWCGKVRGQPSKAVP